MIERAALAELLIFWIVWFYPFVFRAPHWQKREHVTVAGPSLAGLLIEIFAVFLAFYFHGPVAGMAGLTVSIVFGILAVVMGWSAVTHLGRQLRIFAGLYRDHELVRTGPYAVVRHPIYASLLAMLLCTIFAWSRWPWALVSIAVFLLGTEIRVRTEDRLLASRFGEAFQDWQRKTPAYLPLVR